MGGKDSIIGGYALQPDGTCYFVAADYDRHTPSDPDPWNDVQAYLDVCEVNELPAYVLRSKSGNGFHVYIFFKEAVPAWKARIVCFELLKEAEVVGDDVKLSTFDRLFPNQDKLTGKGFGNLIALPFQGSAGLHGHTLLLNPETGYKEPYLDQWAILREIKKATEADLDRLISEWQLEREKAPAADWNGKINGDKDFQPLDVPGIIHGVPEGGRDEAIFREACRLREKGLRREEVEVIIYAMADACTPPFPRNEASQKINSAWKYEPSAETAASSVKDTLQWIETTDNTKDILAGWLNRITGMDAPDVEAIKEAVHRKTGTKKGILNTLLKEQKSRDKKARSKARAEKKSKKRAEIGIKEIMYYPTSTGKCCHKVSEALRDHIEQLIYRYGGNLIKIVNQQPTTVKMVQKIHDRGGKYPPMPTIVQLSWESLCHEIEKVAVCQIIDEEGTIKDIPWPKNILSGILALTEGHEKPLVGIVEHPFIDNEFKPVMTKGYDNATGLYNIFDVVPDIGFFKTADDALIFLMDEVLKDFPFASPLDEMAAVACLLTGMQRKLINSGCPGFVFTAPIQSSGKTTLCQIVSQSLFGRPAPASSFSDDDTEMAKHLLGILQEGHSVILFDNLPEGSVVESNELAKAITSDTYSNRWLGKNKTVTVPSSVLWMMTGNNISICGDFNTRFLIIELDPRDANPDQRRFKREDIGAWCEQHRGKILGACMRIIMDGAGYKHPDLRPSRFPSWDKFVRLPLHKISNIDVAEIFQKNKLSDPKIEGQRIFFETWYNTFGAAPMTAREIIDQCKSEDSITRFDRRPMTNELHDAIADIFPGGLPSTRALGKWLAGMKNRFFGDYKLVHAGQGTTRDQLNKSLWSVVPAEASNDV